MAQHTAEGQRGLVVLVGEVLAIPMALQEHLARQIQVEAVVVLRGWERPLEAAAAPVSLSLDAINKVRHER